MVDEPLSEWDDPPSRDQGFEWVVKEVMFLLIPGTLDGKFGNPLIETTGL